MASSLPSLLLRTLAVVLSTAWPVRKASGAPTAVTVLALVPERPASLPWAWPRVAPALSLALAALEPGLRHHAGLAFHAEAASLGDGTGACTARAAKSNLTALQASRDPDVLLLGWLCKEATGKVGALASGWGLPLLTAGILPPGITSKKGFGTAVYAGPAGGELGVFLTHLHRHFNWTSSVALVFSSWFCYYSLLRHPHLRWGTFTVHQHLYRQPDEAVRFIQASGRVVYICGPVEMLHKIMDLAQGHNMTEGDYVFIYMDIFGESLAAEGHREAAKPWQSKENQDLAGLQEAFQTVLVITLHEPQTPEYQRFQSQLILRAQRDFDVVLKESLENLVAGCFHDGLLLYAMALNETLHEGGTKQNTTRILDKMRSRTFLGVTGTVIMNSNREREGDFDLWSMADVESGEYQVTGHYMASEKQINWTGPICWKKGPTPCVSNTSYGNYLSRAIHKEEFIRGA